MRSVGQNEDLDEKSKNRAKTFALIFLGMMVVSSIGYAFLSNPNSGLQTGQISSGITQVGDRWVFAQGDREITLTYGPNEVSNISVLLSSSLSSFVQEPLFLDIENPGILSEISNALQSYPSRMQEACYGSCERNLPEKNCTENIIIFKENVEQQVSQVERCIFIEGDMRAADAFIYNILNIYNS